MGNSIFHKCPAVVKLILLPVLSILVFSLPVWLAASLILILFFCELAIHFSLR
jgi:energy-coupling factor transporter transmembrane protein EcfT